MYKGGKFSVVDASWGTTTPPSLRDYIISVGRTVDGSASKQYRSVPGRYEYSFFYVSSRDDPSCVAKNVCLYNNIQKDFVDIENVFGWILCTCLAKQFGSCLMETQPKPRTYLRIFLLRRIIRKSGFVFVSSMSILRLQRNSFNCKCVRGYKLLVDDKCAMDKVF